MSIEELCLSCIGELDVIELRSNQMRITAKKSGKCPRCNGRSIRSKIFLRDTPKDYTAGVMTRIRKELEREASEWTPDYTHHHDCLADTKKEINK